MLEQNKSRIIHFGAKQTTCCRCRSKTKSLSLIPEQNKRHVVDVNRVKTKAMLLMPEKNKSSIVHFDAKQLYICC